VNPKDDEDEKNQFTIAPLPYELLMQTPMAQSAQYPTYPMPQTPQPQEQQPQAQSQQAKKKITTGQLMLIIIGILIFVEFPPPIDLVGLGLIVYSLKKYWSRKS
jgi:hypothetical protein